MNRIILFVLAASTIIFFSCDSDRGTNTVIVGGERFQVGGIKIPVLAGDYSIMGQQLGTLMNSEIKELYQIMVEGQAIDFDSLLAAADELWETILPQWFKDLCQGMAITSGLSREQLIAMETLSKTMMENGACSGILLGGNYTEDGGMLMGRNWDSEFALAYAHLFCVTIYKPLDGEHQFAVFGFPGIISVYSGVNDEGLCIEQNAAPMAVAFTPMDSSVLWRPVKSFEWLRDYGSVDELREPCLQTPVSFGCNYQIMDSTEFTCFETASDIILERDMDAEYLICETNHFVHPDLQAYNQWMFGSDTTGSTFIRRQNLLDLAEEFKEAFTDSVLMNSVLLIPQLEGGIKQNTIGSFVYKPSDLTVLIGVPDDIITPVLIDLDDYFN